MKRLSLLVPLTWATVAFAQGVAPKNDPPAASSTVAIAPSASAPGSSSASAPPVVSSAPAASAVASGVASPPAASSAPSPVAAAPPAPEPLRAPVAVPRWGEARLGFRADFIGSAGYDPYRPSGNDGQLASTHLGFSGALYQMPRYSVRAGVALDGGISRSAIRGYDSRLSVVRMGVPVDFVYRKLSGVFHPFVRLTPGVAVVSQTIDIRTGTSDFASGNAWTWMLDSTVGANIYFERTGAMRQPNVVNVLGFGLFIEGGYGVTGRVQPNLVARQAATSSLALRTPAFSASGPLVRLGAMLTF